MIKIKDLLSRLSSEAKEESRLRNRKGRVDKGKLGFLYSAGGFQF